MERYLLMRLLTGDDEASMAALAALPSGANHVAWDGTLAAELLARTYTRQLRQTRRKSIETLGLDRAVQFLSRPAGATHSCR